MTAKPQNDLELSEHVSAIGRYWNALNLAVREGHLYKASAILGQIEHAADRGQRRIGKIVDMAG